MMQPIQSKWTVFLALGLGALMLTRESGGTQRLSAPLEATTASPGSRGWSEVGRWGTSTARFTVVGKRLARGAVFDVIVGGVKIAELTTNGGGNGKVRLRSHSRDHRLGFDPRGEEIVVRDHEGRDCLVGVVPGDGPDSASGACCFMSDDHSPRHAGQARCEDLDASACAAAGGTPSSAPSCFPNPCVQLPPPLTFACCIAESASGALIDDASHIRCEEETSVEACTGAGGKVMSATSCDPDPCHPVPPAEHVGCCLAEHCEHEDGDDHDRMGCRELTPERCAALGGSAGGAFCGPSTCPDHDDDADHHGPGDEHHGDEDHGGHQQDGHGQDDGDHGGHHGRGEGDAHRGDHGRGPGR